MEKQQQSLRQQLKKKIKKISEQKPDSILESGRNYPIEGARKILEMIPDEQLADIDIFPTFRHSIQFETDEEGIYAELEVFHDKISCIRVIDRNYQSSLFTEFPWERSEAAVKFLSYSQELIRQRREQNKKRNKT